MDKNKIKSYLSSNFLTEAKETADKPVGLKKTEDIQKANKSINTSALKDVAKDVKSNSKSLDANKATNAKEVKKRELDKGEKETHDNVELFQDTMLALDYDSPVDDVFKDRFEKSLAGHPTMGNSNEYANVVQDKVWGGDPNFGQSLVDKTKAMAKVQQNVVGGGNTMLPYGVKNGNYAMNENNNINKKDKMKRLVFKKPFNGLSNALDLIPESYRVDDKEFEMTDGNESYKMRWEGTLNEGRAIVLMGSTKELVNEDIAKIKHLMGYSSEKTLGNLKGNQRLDENQRFSDIWGKTKSLLTESEDIDGPVAEPWMQKYFLTRDNFWGQNGNHKPGKLVWGTVGGGGAVPASPDFESKEEALQYAIEKGWKQSGQISMKQVSKIDDNRLTESEDIDGQDAPEGEWDEETMKAAEATKHVEGSVAKTKNYPNSPAPKHGQFADVKKKATEATKDVEGSVSNEKNYPNTPSVKTGEWDKNVKGQAADAKKHIHMHESYMNALGIEDSAEYPNDNILILEQKIYEELNPNQNTLGFGIPEGPKSSLQRHELANHIASVLKGADVISVDGIDFINKKFIKEKESVEDGGNGMMENELKPGDMPTVNDFKTVSLDVPQLGAPEKEAIYTAFNNIMELFKLPGNQFKGTIQRILLKLNTIATEEMAKNPQSNNTADTSATQMEEGMYEEGTYEEYDRLEEIFGGMDEELVGDLDDNGELSDYEQRRTDAIQKAMRQQGK